jgi:hypothetical protein
MLKQGDQRIWNPRVDGIKDFPVRIVGLAHSGVPILGLTYIVELSNPIKGYPYTHATAFEVHLK